jgi:hypothetical protein
MYPLWDVGLLQLGFCIYTSENSPFEQNCLLCKLLKGEIALGTFASCISMYIVECFLCFCSCIHIIEILICVLIFQACFFTPK